MIQENPVSWGQGFAGSEHPETAAIRVQKEYVDKMIALKRENMDRVYAYLSALIERGRVESDEARRIAIYRDMQQKVVADAPDIFGVLEKRKLALASAVKGFAFVPVASNAIECFGLSI